MATDGSGDVYLTGYTSSYDYPTTAGAFDRVRNGTVDGFVTRLSGSLAGPLQASTLVGGNGGDFPQAVALGGAGVYVAGYTGSDNFPRAGGGTYTGLGGTDIFVLNLGPNLDSLVASAFIGGAAYDYAMDLAVEQPSPGKVYVAGYSDSEDYPHGQLPHAGVSDIIVSRLDLALSRLEASTFLGGDGADQAYAAVMGGSGEIFLAGSTNSTAFPVTEGAYDTQRHAGSDAVVIKLSVDLGIDPSATPAIPPPSVAPTETSTPMPNETGMPTATPTEINALTPTETNTPGPTPIQRYVWLPLVLRED